MICPTCGHSPARTPQTSLRRTLGAVGGEWSPIRHGASRWLCSKLAARYPTHEFRHVRVSLQGGALGAWTVEARRRP